MHFRLPPVVALGALLVGGFWLRPLTLCAQAPASVGVGTATPNPAAALDVQSSTQGLLPPRLSRTQRRAIQNPPPGLLVYQTGTASPADSAGFWLRGPAGWQYLEPLRPPVTLSKAGTQISLGGGGSGTVTDADNQTLSIAGSTISLTNGGAVTVPSSADNLGNHTATQPVRLNGNWLSNDGGNEGIRVDNGGNVGVGTTTPRGKLDVDGPGDIYLVDDPNSGSAQSVLLPGHLFLAPFNGATGAAYIQSRVLNPTAASSGSLVLRTQSGTSLTDALTLAPNGEAAFGNTVTAPQYNFTTAQTRTLVLPAAAFTSAVPASYQFLVNTVESGGVIYPTYGFLSTGNPAQEGYVVAPVNLPSGAVITGLQLVAYDQDATSRTPQVGLSGIAISAPAGFYSAVFGAQVALTSESTAWQTVSTPVSHTVDNNALQYQVGIRLRQATGAMGFSSVRITYTVGRAD